MTSLVLTVQPVGTVALAALILGESPSGLQLVGVVVILAAMMVATRPVSKARLSEQVLRLRSDQRRGAGSVVGNDVAVGAADQD